MNNNDGRFLAFIVKFLFRNFSVVINELHSGQADLTIRKGVLTLSRHSAASHSRIEVPLSEFGRIIESLRNAK